MFDLLPSFPLGMRRPMTIEVWPGRVVLGSGTVLPRLLGLEQEDRSRNLNQKLDFPTESSENSFDKN